MIKIQASLDDLLLRSLCDHVRKAKERRICLCRCAERLKQSLFIQQGVYVEADLKLTWTLNKLWIIINW